MSNTRWYSEAVYTKYMERYTDILRFRWLRLYLTYLSLSLRVIKIIFDHTQRESVKTGFLPSQMNGRTGTTLKNFSG